jgi:phospholipid/cholesterol/gamma-HCH transport system substrate-binding protein
VDLEKWMKNRINEIQVGILTVFALVVLIGGMMWLKNIDLSKGQNFYQADFSNVAGLREGDKVQVRGIRMGEVSAMQILQGAVRVEVQVDDSVDLREDAVFILGEKGIVGEVVIEIDPGTGERVLEGHIFQGRTAGTIAAMTDAAGAALAEMRVLTAKITQLVEEVKVEGKVVETLTQANETLTKIDDMVQDNHSDIVVILDNLLATSNELRRVMESGRIERTFDDASAAMASADSLMNVLSESSVRLESILTKLDEGDGTAAMLLNDPTLYTSADSTMVSIRRLVDELRRNPKKYFKMSVMDF